MNINFVILLLTILGLNGAWSKLARTRPEFSYGNEVSGSRANTYNYAKKEDHNNVTRCSQPLTSNKSKAFKRKEILWRLRHCVQCKPREQIVELEPNLGPQYSFLPTVAQVKRCMGFCYSDKTSCQPTAVSIRIIEVLKTARHTSEHEESIDEVPVEDHVACACEAYNF